MASASQPASSKLNSGKTNFGGAAVDGNRVALIGYESWFQTQDATPTTALISPLTVTTGAVANIIVPPNATTMTIVPKTNNVQVSEIVGTTSLSQYFEIPAGLVVSFDVTRINNIYLLGVSSSSVVSFYFGTI